jgi:hypothetical protein
LPSATRGALFEKTAPLDPLQKLLIIFYFTNLFNVSGSVKKMPGKQYFRLLTLHINSSKIEE